MVLPVIAAQTLAPEATQQLRAQLPALPALPEPPPTATILMVAGVGIVAVAAGVYLLF